MTLRMVIWVLANTIVAVATIGCIVTLHRFSRNTKHSRPIVAICIIGVTALINGLQFPFPEVLADFRRNREALLAGEWWRMVTPLFVQSFGWWQCCVNGVAAVIVCPLAERFYGKRLLALYFVPGILGEVFAYFWAPNGAGSSLGIAGVEGGLFAFTFFHRLEISRSARTFAIFGIASAVAMSVNRDNHGPAILFGVLLAGMMTILWPDTARARMKTPGLEKISSTFDL